MGWAVMIVTLPWMVTGAVGLSIGGVAAVSRRARRALSREIWGD